MDRQTEQRGGIAVWRRHHLHRHNVKAGWENGKARQWKTVNAQNRVVLASWKRRAEAAMLRQGKSAAAIWIHETGLWGQTMVALTSTKPEIHLSQQLIHCRGSGLNTALHHASAGVQHKPGVSYTLLLTGMGALKPGGGGGRGRCRYGVGLRQGYPRGPKLPDEYQALVTSCQDMSWLGMSVFATGLVTVTHW